MNLSFKPIPEEKRQLVRQLRLEHPEWGARRISKVSGISATSVRRISKRCEETRINTKEPNPFSLPTEVKAGSLKPIRFRPQLKTIVLTQPKDFEKLFEGFTSLRAVSYVHSPDLLLEFLEEKGYDKVEWVAGDREHIEDDLRRALASKGVEPILHLMNLVRAGRFRLWIPKRLIHSKLYLLSREDGNTRVILGSPNFTNMANSGRQVNYAAYMDLTSDHQAILGQCEDDYVTHQKMCTLFLDDLVKLCEGKTEEQKRSEVELWIEGAEPAERQAKMQTQGIIKEALGRAFRIPDSESLVITLPESPDSRRKIQKSLPDLFKGREGIEVPVTPQQFLGQLQKVTKLPLMHIDEGKVWLSYNGRRELISQEPTVPEVVNSDLATIEAYCDTVELGRSSNQEMAKAGIFETLLYILASPFAHQYQIALRERWPLQRRGPRFLYLYGQSRNGKTQLLRYGYYLLSGAHVELLQKDHFTKSNIQGSTTTQSTFPLIFDDIAIPRRGPIEQLLKTHWEVSWDGHSPQMQLIMSSNTGSLDEWAKSRSKLIVLSTHFAATEQEKDTLTSLTGTRNSIFKWFSHKYLQLWRECQDKVATDELFVARLTMIDLYKFAGRELPRYFCQDKPVEERYNQGREEWLDLLERMKAATLKPSGDKAVIEFKLGVANNKIAHYQGLLPSQVSSCQVGLTLQITPLDEFLKWYKQGNKGGVLGSIRRVFKR